MATLPTAWLAPPDNISSANHSTSIAPVPLAVSAAVAVTIGIVVIILFFRKDKDVFLEDRISAKTTSSTADNINRHSPLPPLRNALPIQRPPSIHAKRIKRQPSFELEPKIDELLEFKNLNWDSEHAMQTPQLPLANQYDFTPSHGDDRSDVDTLQDDEKNSAYVPYPSSEASDDTYRYGQGRGRGARDLQVLDDESVSRGSQMTFESRSNLGDAY